MNGAMTKTASLGPIALNTRETRTEVRACVAERNKFAQMTFTRLNDRGFPAPGTTDYAGVMPMPCGYLSAVFG